MRRPGRDFSLWPTDRRTRTDDGCAAVRCYSHPVPPPTNFWTEYKDLLALFVAFLALIVSSVTTWWTLNTTRKLAKQNLDTTREIAENAAKHSLLLMQTATYQRIHELLVE